MSTKNLSSQQLRHENILRSLAAIHAHGWLRASELGAYIWPKNALPKVPASALVKAMLAAGLVHPVALPDRAGQALLLTRRGATMLRQEQKVDATAREKWEAPSSWRHDIMAVGLLAQLYRRGWQVIPEAEIRRRVSLRSVPKIPDGMTRDPEGAWWWVEMENARKSGPAMRHLAQTAANIGLGGVPLLNTRPVGMLVGYPATARDEGGHCIDHRQRVTRAIERVCRGPVRLTWAACTLSGAGVESCGLEASTAYPDRARRALGVLEAQGWHQNMRGTLTAQHPPYQAHVWRSDTYERPWAYDIDGPGVTPYAEAEIRPPVSTITEAKMATATLIAEAIAAEKAARARKRL